MFFHQWISITLCSIQMLPLNMDTISGTSEIVETMEESYSDMKMDEHVGKRRMLKLKPGQICSIEDDINKLFEAIDMRTTGRNLGLLERVGKDSLRKNAMKRPMRSGSSQSSGIQIAESVKLKQALRGLCLSQASEMATMKRLSKQADSSRSSEPETIKRLYRAVVHEASESSLPLDEGKCNSVHISLVPEGSTLNFSEKTSESGKTPKQERLQQHAHSSTLLVDESATPEEKMIKIPPADEIVPFSTHGGSEISMLELGWNGKPKLTHSSPVFHTKEKLPVLDDIIPATAEFPKSLERVKEQKDKLHFASSLSRDKNASNNVIKSSNSSRHVMRSVFRNKNFVKKKAKQDSTSIPCDGGVDHVLAPSMNKMVSKGPKCTLVYGKTEKDIPSPSSSIANVISEVRSTAKDLDPDKPVLSSSIGNRTRATILKADEKSRSREKGDISQSSKSSIGEYSSSTSHSEESTLSGSSRSGNRPHMSKVLRWEAIRHVQKQHGSVGLRHFKLLMKLGSGDIGTVYLAELTGTNCLFALKMMNSEFLDCKKKLHRAQTEREILQMLDHPFLPTLFTHFTTERFACLVMEHCPGGDLHVLRQKQPNKSFSEQAARFYVAEVLLALEYLHMLGVVYRDLKPENVLVRDDGHIMLTDFDLSLRCAAVNPTLLKSSPVIESPKRGSPSPCTEASCIHPFCLQPSWQVPCFTPRLLSTAAKTRMLKPDLATQVTPLPQLVAEPTTARSNSFVGTHEYLAPEIIKGEGHGSAVDWWTFGIFLYELLYGKTPFKGPASEDTLSNVVSRSLKFPSIPSVGSYTRDLIRGLLVKEPENRLGSVKGAAEIMRHPFFEGLNWALIRCAIPPEIPRVCDYVNFSVDMSLQNMESARCPEVCKTIGENMEFEMF